MSIKGLQTDQPGLARAGVIRLGYKAKKCQCGQVVEGNITQCPKCKGQQFGKEFPREAPHFVLSDAPGLAEALGTDKPTELNIFFPFDDLDQVFPAFMQHWVASSLLCRGDGEKILYAIEQVSGKATIRDGIALVDFQESYATGKRQQIATGELMPCPGLARDLYAKCKNCKPNAMLLIMIRNVPRLAYWQISTTSIHNIKNLTEQLNTVREIVNRLTGSPRLTGVPFILRRVKKSVSTPKGQGNGGRQRVDKWFLELEIEPDWVTKMIMAQRQLVDPMQRLAIPAVVEPASVSMPVAPAAPQAGFSDPPVWEPRDYEPEPEEVIEGEWQPEPVAPPPPANGNGIKKAVRPLSPQTLKEMLEMKVAKSTLKDPNTGEWLPINLHPLGEKTANILVSRFQACFTGKDLPESTEAMYKTCLFWLTNHVSASELTAAQADVILDWLVGSEHKTERFKATVVEYSAIEARAVYNQALAEVKAFEEAETILGPETLWPEDELPEMEEVVSYPD